MRTSPYGAVRFLAGALVLTLAAGCSDATGPGPSRSPVLLFDVTPNTAAAETNSELQYTIAVFNTTPDTVWVTHVEGFLHNPTTGQGHGGGNSDLVAIPPFDLWTTKLGMFTMPDWPAGRWVATAKVITRTQYLQKTQDVTIQP